MFIEILRDICIKSSKFKRCRMSFAKLKSVRFLKRFCSMLVLNLFLIPLILRNDLAPLQLVTIKER